MHKIFNLVLLVIIFISSNLWAQNSWTDSNPRIIKIVQNNCPIKVRDKNGQWADFADPIPAGRSVLASLNPRRPDIIFFQLQRDSRFLFVAPRTCFEGEADWNVRALDEKRGHKEPSKNRFYLATSPQILYSGLNFVSDDGKTKTPLRKRTMGLCTGAGYEKLTGDQWYMGGFGCLGIGSSKLKLAEEKTASYSDSDGAFTLYGLGRFTSYYDFMKLPYAMGFEVHLGFIKSSHETTAVGYTVSPTFALQYGVAAGWRFYWEKVIISPKLVFNKFLPKYTGLELQLGYVF